MSSTPDKNPEEVLRQEILADARRQAERLLRKAKKEVEDLAAAAEKSVADERAKTVGGAEAAARRRTDLVLAKVPVEEARIRAARACRAERHGEREERGGDNRRDACGDQHSTAVDLLFLAFFLAHRPSSSPKPASLRASSHASRTSSADRP